MRRLRYRTGTASRSDSNRKYGIQMIAVKDHIGRVQFCVPMGGPVDCCGYSRWLFRKDGSNEKRIHEAKGL